MKTLTAAITFTAAFAVLLPQLLTAQERTDVPDAVLSVFRSAYPHVKEVEWEVEGEYFEAEYEENGLERTVRIDGGGNIIAVEREIPIANLPASILDYVGAAYGLSSIEEAEMKEAGGKTFYVVELEGDDGEIELTFDRNGTLVGGATEVDDGGQENDDDR